MKTNFKTIALALVSTLIASTSFAGNANGELYPAPYSATQLQAGVTRVQVQAELAQAIRSGDIVAGGEVSASLNDLYPSRYPARQITASLTRAQVNAELANAIHTGDIMMGGETSAKCKELHPGMHQAM